jgi:hypothetical protein
MEENNHSKSHIESASAQNKITKGAVIVMRCAEMLLPFFPLYYL